MHLIKTNCTCTCLMQWTHVYCSNTDEQNYKLPTAQNSQPRRKFQIYRRSLLNTLYTGISKPPERKTDNCMVSMCPLYTTVGLTRWVRCFGGYVFSFLVFFLLVWSLLSTTEEIIRDQARLKETLFCSWSKIWLSQFLWGNHPVFCYGQTMIFVGEVPAGIVSASVIILSGDVAMN